MLRDMFFAPKPGQVVPGVLLYVVGCLVETDGGSMHVLWKLALDWFFQRWCARRAQSIAIGLHCE